MAIKALYKKKDVQRKCVEEILGGQKAIAC